MCSDEISRRLTAAACAVQFAKMEVLSIQNALLLGNESMEAIKTLTSARLKLEKLASRLACNSTAERIQITEAAYRSIS